MQPTLPVPQKYSSWKTSFIFVSLALVLGSAVGIFIVRFDNPVFILLGLIGLVAFIGTIASVEVGFLFLVFITYARVSDVAVHFHNAPSVAQVFIALLMLVIFVRWVVFHEKPIGWQLPALLLAIYGLIGFSSVAYAEDAGLVVYKLSNYVKDAVIALLAVVLMRRPPILRHVVWSLLASGIFMGTLSVFQYFTGTFTNNYGGFAQSDFQNIVGSLNNYRVSGPIGDANFYSQIMLVLVPIALERMLHESKLILKIVAGWAAVACFLTVVFTFSRGGFLGLVAALLMFALLNPPRYLDIVVVVAMGVGLLFFVPTSYYDRMLTLDSLLPGQNGQGINVRSDRSFQGRASQVLTAWSMIKQYPLLGVGWNNSASRYQEFSKEIGLAPSASNRSLHSLYLEVAAETGILGFSSFFMLVWLAIRSIIVAWKTFVSTNSNEFVNITAGLAAGLCGYLTASFFVHSAYPRPFYLLIGIVFTLPLIAKQIQLEQKDGQIQA